MQVRKIDRSPLLLDINSYSFCTLKPERGRHLKNPGPFIISAYYNCIAANLRYALIHHAMAKSLQRSFYQRGVLAAISWILRRRCIFPVAHSQINLRKEMHWRNYRHIGKPAFGSVRIAFNKKGGG